MAMSKRDFIALADAIRPLTQDRRNDGETVQKSELLTVLVRFQSAQNVRFNSSRWLSYLRGECGPNGGAIKKVQG